MFYSIEFKLSSNLLIKFCKFFKFLINITFLLISYYNKIYFNTYTSIIGLVPYKDNSKNSNEINII